MRHQGHASTIRLFKNCLTTVNSTTLLKSDCQWPLFTWQQLAVGIVDAPGAAPALLTEDRVTTPQLGGGIVIVGQPTLDIGGVQGADIFWSSSARAGS